MKIIDLLNKIANGEALPKKIHIREFQSDFIFNGYTYLSDDKESQNIFWCLHSDALNYKVEIIEENKIPEKLGKIDDNDGYIDQNDVIRIARKVDEIIDYFKSKGEV